MADAVINKQTHLSTEEVITRAIQFFSTENWRATSQSGRAATFEGKVAVPWLMLLLTVLGYIACFIPGIIMYVMVVRKVRRFQNLVVTASPKDGGSEVVVTCPPQAKKLASRFLEALPA
jgi:hypothetical protein